jgi:hypothetical protein
MQLITRERTYSALAILLVLASSQRTFAQSPSRYDATLAQTYDRPNVSPYLQLLNSQPSGLSNYQTLVRPLIEEREARARQSVSLQRLQRQAALSASTMGQRAPADQSPRRMYFSHYYPTITAKMTSDSTIQR